MRAAIKPLMCMAALLCISCWGQSQILKNIGNRVKQKVEQRADRKVDQTIDKGLDKTEDAAKKLISMGKNCISFLSSPFTTS
jgi:hypothetical protein